MKYLGGKARLSKRIGEHLDEALMLEKDFYEPFVGGFNIVQNIHTWGKKYCSDNNWALITMYKALRKGWVPPTEVSELEYDEARLLPEDDPLKAFIGVACSFGGKWFGGYARGRYNYALEGHRTLMQKAPVIKQCFFRHCDYDDITPEGAVIYCDPPYANTTGYRFKFDSERFWVWCQLMAKTNDVFVSEYDCPINHELMFEVDQTNSINESLTMTECLFKVLP
jgi:DNA adenine methylase